jgi:hypothetical protein
VSTRFAAIVGMVRRLRCLGRHRWISLDLETRQCYRCDMVQRRVFLRFRGRCHSVYGWRTANASVSIPGGGPNSVSNINDPFNNERKS